MKLGLWRNHQRKPKLAPRRFDVVYVNAIGGEWVIASLDDRATAEDVLARIKRVAPKARLVDREAA